MNRIFFSVHRGGSILISKSTSCNNRFIPTSHLAFFSRRRSFSSLVTAGIKMKTVATFLPRVMDHQHVSNVTSSTTFRHFDTEALMDLFFTYADKETQVLDFEGIRALMAGIGETPCDGAIEQLFQVADNNGDGDISLDEFLEHAASFVGDNPARIILVVGGPGSGKGVLSKRLERECNAVHLSSGDMLRKEVEQNTSLGRQVKEIMARGELVSSAMMVALMKKRMKDHPGKRVLLDGFPRSLENAHDFVSLCGRPELALHLVCDDTILMERIMMRGMSSGTGDDQQKRREDDNFQTALQRLRTYHKYHNSTIEWLRDQHVPIVNLDCSGDQESVWQQLVAIGKLMRPAVKNVFPVPSPASTGIERKTA